MNTMNISEYKLEAGEYRTYYSRVTLKAGYYIANFDERFFHLVGVKRVYLSVPEILHPDDVELFMEAVSGLEEGPQHLLARVIAENDKYRYFYVILQYNGSIVEDFRSIDMELAEIMSLKDRYKEYNILVEKYREYMTLFTGMFLEYEYGTGHLKLYEYENRRSKMRLDENLESVYSRVVNNDALSLDQKAEFQILYQNLKKGRDHSKVDLDAVTLLEQEEQVRYEIRLSMIYWEEARDRVIGLVNIISQEQPKKSYYLSDSAFDPGTGLLNKKAISEYAIEKIHNHTKGLWLAVIDVDDFKRVNDNFGHMFGDEVLAKVAEIIRSVVKARGMVGRFGGDEFMVVFEGVETETDLRRILATIGKNVNWAFNDVEGLKVTTTTGVSKYPEDGTSYEDLFRTADKCVYIGKGKGKNRYIIYDINKHGPVEKETSNRINIGLKAAISNERKNEVVSDLMLQLHNSGKDALVFVMEQMQAYFDIDGIALYAGEKLERICSVGNYMNPIQDLACVRESSYQDFFDDQGFCEISRTAMLEHKAPEAYQLYRKQENGKLIQCVAVRDGLPVSLVSYDYFNRFPKAGTTDLGMIRIVGRMMAEIVAKDAG